VDKSIIPKPEIEIIEDGKVRSDERIDPSVMQFLMQAASTSQLVKLRKLEESKVPTGVKPLKRTVTDTIMKLPLYPPWISFSLINDGAGALTVWVNDEADPFAESMIANGESYECDAKYPVIKSIYLKAASGTTAAVRIYGKEGRPQRIS